MSVFEKFKSRIVPKKTDVPGQDVGPSNNPAPSKISAQIDIDAVARGVQRAARASLEASTAKPLDAATFDTRKNTRRAYENTSHEKSARMATNAIIDYDPKFQKVPGVVKEHFKELMFELLTAARKSPDVFYKKLADKRVKLSGDKTMLMLLLTSLSTCLMGEKFKYDPSRAFRAGQTEGSPVWEVAVCKHEDLFFDQPKVTARQNAGAPVQVELIHVFNGLIKL